jgi:hypothetical protein
MRHALLACVSRSASVISSRLVAQYSDVPSVARTRNTLISPKPLSQQSVPSPHSPASETACSLPLRLTLICRFAFSRVKKCQPKERDQFQFSIEAVPTVETNQFGIKTALESCCSSISAKWSFLVLPSRSLSNTR